MGADFFPEGGKNASRIVIPQIMAVGAGVLCALLGEGERGGRGGETIFLQKKKRFFVKT